VRTGRSRLGSAWGAEHWYCERHIDDVRDLAKRHSLWGRARDRLALLLNR
jgi:hypothetical protein